MKELPFAGRMPIFIGDDQTDYGGFAAVRRDGGLAIAVGPRVSSEWRLPGPTAVRRWLEQLAVPA
jgi:trehalose 6-phosphate phosphatase